MSQSPNESNYVKVSGNEEKKKRPNRPWLSWVLVAAILIVIAGSIAYGASHFGDEDIRDSEWSSPSENVAVINVTGTITDEGNTYNQDWIIKTIRNARYDKNNKAILLRINSPGGGVYESQETYAELLDYKKETNRPVYAYCEQLTASGGYYIAAAADEIYSNQESFVGSIGVIGGQFVDATALLDKLGVKITAPHSGKNKLMGNFFEKPTEEQLAIMQSISDEAYEQFVGIVKKARGDKVADVRALADGRIYSARQAKANGLVDGLMRFEDYQDRIAKKIKQPDISFEDMAYEPQTSFLDLSNFIATNVKPLQGIFHSSNELQSTIDTLNSMEKNMPMYLYEGARP